jgi:lysophospholipase-3
MITAMAAVGLALVPMNVGTASVRPAVPGASAAQLTPVVLFPAFHFTRLLVTVRHQHVDRACPSSGRFQDWFGHQVRGPFTQVCRDELLTMRYHADTTRPIATRFANQRGVTVHIMNYGHTQSAPFYEPMYRALVNAGYVRDKNIRVAGYDSRLTPDMGNFLPRTKRLIEHTYRSNGNRPVHLVGHSNGPLYAQYLLTHTTAAWKARYIHGFTPIAGNFPGQGLLYSVLFTGLNVSDFSYPTRHANAVSSARMYLSAPSSYMSAATPTVFGSRETVIQDQATGRRYTPSNYPQLFADAHLLRAARIARHYVGFVRFAKPAWFPDVDVYAERGTALPTAVGIKLPNLTVGQLLSDTTSFYVRDGDGNQEDVTNTAIRVWQAMPCFRFSMRVNMGVNHFDLPANPSVLSRLVADANRPRSDCR